MRIKPVVHQLVGIAILVSATMPALAQASAADTYKAKCQMCHGADGVGATPAGKAMKARSFSDPDVLKESDADFIAVIKNGKAKMPAYGAKMSDGEIKGIVAYIHTLQKK